VKNKLVNLKKQTHKILDVVKNLFTMNLKTNKILLASILIIAITFIFATFWETLGLGPEETPLLAITLMIAFVFNIAGLIVAFSERKIDKRKSTIGILGHSFLIVGFLVVVSVSLSTLN
jgi:hypothetical protein